MATSITINLIHLAAAEGIQTALDQIGDMNAMLETFVECGSDTERAYAAALIVSLGEAVHQITKTNAVALARADQTGDEAPLKEVGK